MKTSTFRFDVTCGGEISWRKAMEDRVKAHKLRRLSRQLLYEKLRNYCTFLSYMPAFANLAAEYAPPQ
jgi:hypothetical protein